MHRPTLTQPGLSRRLRGNLSRPERYDKPASPAPEPSAVLARVSFLLSQSHRGFRDCEYPAAGVMRSIPPVAGVPGGAAPLGWSLAGGCAAVHNLGCTSNRLALMNRDAWAIS